MGFELSRMQIMEVSEKRCVQALDICLGYTVTTRWGIYARIAITY